MSLLAPFKELTATAYQASWRSPANIAFVKYWGKKGHQLPANPSLSMTLKQCYTESKVSFTPAENLEVKLQLAGSANEAFAKKIQIYLENLKVELPWLHNLNVNIETKNTFPYGAGIASSASGLSAFALCLTDYMYSMQGLAVDEDFNMRASYLARLASGSACRSVYGGFVSWGQSSLSGSSDEYATTFRVHPEVENLQDTILVISPQEKKVSSRAGHGLMKQHPYAEARYAQGIANFENMLLALKNGDMTKAGQMMESEALSLHAMMLTSPDAYTLLRPNTLTAIEIIWGFRRDTKLPLYFTLDAGPNLHLIYPERYKNKVQTFINHELAPLAVKIIDDERGEGPARC